MMKRVVLRTTTSKWKHISPNASNLLKKNKIGTFFCDNNIHTTTTTTSSIRFYSSEKSSHSQERPVATVNVEDILERSKEMMRNQQKQQSVDYLTHCMKQLPIYEQHVLLLGRSRMLMKCKEFEKSYLDLQRCADFFDKDDFYYMEMQCSTGELLFLSKDYERCIALLADTYTTLSDKDIGTAAQRIKLQRYASFLLAEAYRMSEKWEDAIQWYSTSIEIEVSNEALIQYMVEMRVLSVVKGSMQHKYHDLLAHDLEGLIRQVSSSSPQRSSSISLKTLKKYDVHFLNAQVIMSEARDTLRVDDEDKEEVADLIAEAQSNIATALQDIQDTLSIEEQSKPDVVELMVNIHYLQAECHFIMSQYRDATMAIAKVLALNPKHSPSYLMQSKMRMQMFQLDDALQSANNCIQYMKMYPSMEATSYSIYTLRGNAFMLKKYYHEAIVDFTTALELLAETGKKTAAGTVDLSQVDLIQSTIGALTQRSICHAELDEMDLAEEDEKRAQAFKQKLQRMKEAEWSTAGGVAYDGSQVVEPEQLFSDIKIPEELEKEMQEQEAEEEGAEEATAEEKTTSSSSQNEENAEEQEEEEEEEDTGSNEIREAQRRLIKEHQEKLDELSPERRKVLEHMMQSLSEK